MDNTKNPIDKSRRDFRLVYGPRKKIFLLSESYIAAMRHLYVICLQSCQKGNITGRKPNITAKKYNSPKANITETNRFVFLSYVFEQLNIKSNYLYQSNSKYSFDMPLKNIIKILYTPLSFVSVLILIYLLLCVMVVFSWKS